MITISLLLSSPRGPWVICKMRLPPPDRRFQLAHSRYCTKLRLRGLVRIRIVMIRSSITLCKRRLRSTSIRIWYFTGRIIYCVRIVLFCVELHVLAHICNFFQFTILGTGLVMFLRVEFSMIWIYYFLPHSISNWKLRLMACTGVLFTYVVLLLHTSHVQVHPLCRMLTNGRYTTTLCIKVTQFWKSNFTSHWNSQSRKNTENKIENENKTK